jgi:nitrite reductase/ring-hydroxylating ferredoxin subunit
MLRIALSHALGDGPDGDPALVVTAVEDLRVGTALTAVVGRVVAHNIRIATSVDGERRRRESWQVRQQSSPLGHSHRSHEAPRAMSARLVNSPLTRIASAFDARVPRNAAAFAILVAAEARRMTKNRDLEQLIATPVSRRKVLVSLPVLAAIGSVGLTTGCGASIPSASVVYGSPDSLTAGTPQRLAGYDVYVVRTEQGIGAISGRCTHAGCGIGAVADGSFHCGCHGSEFAADGTVTHGPAQRDLAWFEVRIEDGNVVVDPTHEVPKGTYTPLPSSGGEVVASS